MAFMLEIQKTGSTPYVLVDEEKGYFKFLGESFHESIGEFFEPVINWLDTYLESDFNTLTFDFELQYFNSSTTKLLYNILIKMDEHGEGKNITVNWITTEDSDMVIECGEDFQEEMENLQFNLIIT